MGLAACRRYTRGMSTTQRTSSDVLLEQAHYLPTAGVVVLALAIVSSCCGGVIGATMVAPVTLAMLGVSLWAVRVSEAGSDERIDSSRAVTLSGIAVAVVPIGACVGLALAMFGGFVAGFLSAMAGY